jgi:hypothetical protein
MVVRRIVFTPAKVRGCASVRRQEKPLIHPAIPVGLQRNFRDAHTPTADRWVTGRRGRFYDVSYTNASLITPAWTNATPVPRYITSDGIEEWIDDGVDTDPAPWAVTQRLYRIDISLP